MCIGMNIIVLSLRNQFNIQIYCYDREKTQKSKYHILVIST